MKWVGVFFCFLCVACVAPNYKSVEVNTFENEKQVGVYVQSVNVSSLVEHFDRLPHIEEEMPLSPENALRKWVQNRFYPINGKQADQLEIVIEKAYLTQADDKITKWYMLDNVKYTLTYALRFEFVKAGRVIYTHEIGGYETSSLPKRSSIAAKEAVFEKMLNAMIYKVDEQVLHQLPNRFLTIN